MSSFDGISFPEFEQIVPPDRCRELLESFEALTGWPISLTDPQGKTRVSSEDSASSTKIEAFLARRTRSAESDARLPADEAGFESKDACSLVAYEGGLYELTRPLVVAGDHVATAVCGPVFFEAPDESLLRRLAAEIDVDADAPAAILRAMPTRSREEINRVARFCGTLLEPFLAAHFRETRNRAFEIRWNSLFEKMNTGFARLKIVRDEAGAPRDYRAIAVNPAFERLTGMAREELLGKTLLEVVPNVEKTWLDRFHRIAGHGEHEMFIDYSPAFARFYAVDAFCPTSDEMICFVSDVTEIRALRKLLTRREQLFQAVFGCSPLAIEIYDREGSLVDANPAFFKVFGIRGAIEKVIGINLFDDPNLTPDEKDRIQRGEILEVEREFDFDVVRRAVDFPSTVTGTRWLGGVFSPLIIEDTGEVEGYLGLVQDIEQRKRAELSLRESEERLRAVLDALPDLIIHASAAEGRLQLRYPETGEARGHYLLDSEGGGEDGAEIRRLRDQAIRAALETSAVQVYNHSFQEADREVHEEVRVVPLPDGTVLLIVRDVTERVEMQEALRRSDESLRRSNERLEQIIRENGSIMIVLSPDRVVREFNTTAERVFGRKRADVVGKDYMKLFVRAEDTDRILRENGKILEGKPLIGYEQEMLDSAGKPLRVLWNVVPSRDENGEVDGFIGSGFEISELRRLQTELQEAQKMEAVGQLAAGVAHDFNNLLHAILGYAEMLGRVLTLEKARECGQVIAEAGRRGRDLVRHLLLFSRKEPFNPELIDPDSVVMNVLSIAKSAVGENVELLYKPDRKPGRVFADAGQLEQVIMNLCINAQHAIGPKSGCVRINVEHKTLSDHRASETSEPGPGRYVVISVEDDGCGIPREIQDRIFEPFFTTKEVGRGTGLGLASAYAIARRHQGSLTVESEVGAGSVFRLWLPLHDEETVRTSEKQEDSRRLQTRGEKLKDKIILLVEDEELALRLAESTLEAVGCRVLIAKDGVEALERFDAHQDEIDAIVLDLVMPRKSGKDVYEAVARRRPDIPFVFCSGYSQSVVTARFLEEISADILQKPFSSDVLLDRLEKLLGE